LGGGGGGGGWAEDEEDWLAPPAGVEYKHERIPALGLSLGVSGVGKNCLAEVRSERVDRKEAAILLISSGFVWWVETFLLGCCVYMYERSML
jgi:hypothetical protein